MKAATTARSTRTARVVAAPVIPATGKHIQFDRVTKDFAMYLNGTLIGYARTAQQAQVELDRQAHINLTH